MDILGKMRKAAWMIDRQEVKDVSMTKISLQLYSVREHTQTPEDLKETLKKVRNIGYQAIQGGRAAGMTKEEYKEVLDSLGISMTSIARWKRFVRFTI